MTVHAPIRKRIAKEQLRLGMYVCGIDGTWLDHPFWKSRFLLDSKADLDALRASGARGVFIDTGKGLDVLAPASPPPPREEVSVDVPTPEPTLAASVRGSRMRSAPAAPEMARMESYEPRFATDDTPSGLAEELGRAVEIVDHARQTVVDLFDEVRLGRAVEASKLAPLVDEIAASIARNRSAMSSIVRLKSRDEYTYMHSVAVSTLMMNLAGELGLGPQETRDAGLAGLLHDIGKMAVPADVLQKAGALSDREMKLVRTHPARGHELLAQSAGVPAAVLDVCLHHHEKIDGTGYPHRLAAGEISLIARMGAVCDVYDAVTSHRPYKAPWTPAEALTRMADWEGHFDPAVLAAFIRSIGIYPVGTLLRLKSGKLAVVKEQTDVPTKPLIRVFHSIQSATDVTPYDVDLSHVVHKHALASTEDAILSSERPEDWMFEDWESRWPALIGATLS